jgi:catechol 2,3-dioxygenase-like lactoylglutathione lyase family enzyme
MKIIGADHTNWRVRDLQRSLHFYRDVLGLEPFGLEEYHLEERPIVSLRVTPTFILHLRPDSSFEPGPTGGYDHLALVVEGADPEALARHQREAGVEIELKPPGPSLPTCIAGRWSWLACSRLLPRRPSP